MLPECYQSVTKMLPKCYQSVTKMLPKCYQSVTKMLPKCYQSGTKMLPKCYQTLQHIRVHRFIVHVAIKKGRLLQTTESHAKHSWYTLSIPEALSFRSSLPEGFLLLGYDFLSLGNRIPTFRSNLLTSLSRAEMFVLGQRCSFTHA